MKLLGRPKVAPPHTHTPASLYREVPRKILRRYSRACEAVGTDSGFSAGMTSESQHLNKFYQSWFQYKPSTNILEEFLQYLTIDEYTHFEQIVWHYYSANAETSWPRPRPPRTANRRRYARRCQNRHSRGSCVIAEKLVVTDGIPEGTENGGPRTNWRRQSLQGSTYQFTFLLL